MGSTVNLRCCTASPVAILAMENIANSFDALPNDDLDETLVIPLENGR